MASDVRKAWQDFKKKYPDFVKKRGKVKHDVGPLMDTYVKRLDELRKALPAAGASRNAAYHSMQEIDALLDDWSGLARERADVGNAQDKATLKAVEDFQGNFRELANRWNGSAGMVTTFKLIAARIR